MGAGTENFSHEDTKARRFFGRVAKATQTRGNGKKEIKSTYSRSLAKENKELVVIARIKFEVVF